MIIDWRSRETTWPSVRGLPGTRKLTPAPSGPAKIDPWVLFDDTVSYWRTWNAGGSVPPVTSSRINPYPYIFHGGTKLRGGARQG